MNFSSECNDSGGSGASDVRWWRFSTRQLLLITTGVAIIIGLIGSTYRWHQVKQRERSALLQIGPFGGVYTMASARFVRDHPGQETSWLFNNFQNYVAEIDLAPDNWHAQELSEKAIPFDDDAVQLVLDFPQLRKLDIRDAPVTDKSVDVLGRLKYLEYLDVRGTKITYTGASQLRDSLPNCVVEADTLSQPAAPTE